MTNKENDLHYNGELHNKPYSLYENIVLEFYETIKDKSNVLSSDDIWKKRDSFSLFSKSIWSEKSFLDSYIGIKNRLEKPEVIFGLESGICFFKNQIYFITGKEQSDYWFFQIGHNSGKIKISGTEIYDLNLGYKTKISTHEDIVILKDFINLLINLNTKYEKVVENEKIKEKEEILITKSKAFIELDKDNNGEVDLIENDFNKLLNKNQKKVIEIDKNFIHQFVKVSNYIKTKKVNIQKIYETIESSNSKSELDERLNLLKNQIHTYELLVFHSINMIGALVKEDLITFYEIYESFDKIGIYNSNWENEVSERLSNIGDKLDDLMYSINKMEMSIVEEISNLSYITQDSFKDLSKSVSEQLKEVESSIETNNLLSLISTYQLYRINKNTKKIT